MINYVGILNLLRKNQKFTNSEQAAEYLNLSRGGYFQMKNGTGGLSERTLMHLMDGTGLDAVTITAAWMAENAKNEKVRKSWQKWLSERNSIGRNE